MSSDGGRPSDGGSGGGAEAGEPSVDGSASSGARALAVLLGLARQLLLLLIAAVSRSSSLLGIAAGARYARRKWETSVAFDPETAERLSYVYYYWRARLRWPLRLVLAIGLLMLAWRYPWQAFAIIVLAAAGGFTYLTPHMPWAGVLTQPMAAGISVVALLVCRWLPWTSVLLVGVSLWGGLLYASWQLCAAVSCVLGLFYYLPTTALCLLAVAAWLLFFLILPRIALLGTELAVGIYYFPFMWPFLHVVGLCVLFGLNDRKLLLPLGVLCALLCFFRPIAC